MSIKKAIYYVHSLDDVLNSISEPYNVFSVGGFKKSIVATDAIYKSAGAFGSQALAYECLYLWKQRGFSGAPSSPVAFFREHCDVATNTKASTNNMLANHFHGGWIANTSTGFHHGKTYLYDIVSAYRWAGSLGLPKDSRFFTKKPRSDN